MRLIDHEAMPTPAAVIPDSHPLLPASGSFSWSAGRMNSLPVGDLPRERRDDDVPLTITLPRWC